MLPLLISVLAAAISLFIPIFIGPSGMAATFIMLEDMLAVVQAIIFAEAGEKARAIKAAAVSIVFMKSSPENRRNRPDAGYRKYVFSATSVSWRRQFRCCGAKGIRGW